MDLAQAYHYLNNEISDSRTADWPLMANPFLMVLILVGYLEFVLHLGPAYMKDRKPYSLHSVMIVYNISVAIASGIVFYGLLTSGFLTTLSWGCEPVDLSYNPEPLSMARWVWWVLLLKIAELGDTIIFILRKKFQQATFLHIYHHVTTAAMAWIACKYVPGGMWTFIMMPNALVHVVMYMYYLLAALGPNIQRKIAPWKPYLTIIQMVQLGLMFLHTSQSLVPSCEPTRKPLAYIYMFHVVVNACMFWDFYKKAYLKKKSE